MSTLDPYENWITVDCAGEGKILSKKAVSEKIMHEVLKN